MKSRISVNRLAGWLTAGVFTMALAIPISGQGRTPGPPPGAGPPQNINPKRADLLRQTNEARLRSLEMENGAAVENQNRIQSAIVNMKQDFTRIQVLRNDIARSLLAHKPPDYNLITEQTAEINRRAHRLNVYMLAHAPDNKGQNNPADVTSEEMIHALVKLCKLIDGFTENPALKHAEMLDAKEIAKAKDDKARADKDLLAILKLSDSIHKTSDSLRTPK